MRPKTRKAFTLIELLIVVAIIAILAAIAVPNFLEAQTRAKISRVEADFRALATALESYRIDHPEYPPNTGHIDSVSGLIPLSTPVNYIADPLRRDPFKAPGSRSSNSAENLNYIYFCYKTSFTASPILAGRRQVFLLPRSFPVVKGRAIGDFFPESLIQWTLTSYGPDGALQFDDDPLLPDGWDSTYLPYDATNGTKSWGDIHRIGP